jgi:hypothetical protein
MITFQAIIDEARKQKEWIVHSLYENMKEHHQRCHYYSVVAMFNLGDASPFSFCVNIETKDVYSDEPSVKLFTISLGGFGGKYPSKEDLSVTFDNNLAWFERIVNHNS